ncbi:MAG: hypothetical protein IKE25_11005, partial [Clostridia bacterium]|nr:hypothetical protein [Clostridia bacterium]
PSNTSEDRLGEQAVLYRDLWKNNSAFAGWEYSGQQKKISCFEATTRKIVTRARKASKYDTNRKYRDCFTTGKLQGQ